MTKKSKFKYKVEQSVKFKFYDGSVHNGIIKSRQYRNEDNESLPTQWTMPMYTLHSPDNSGRYSRGYMVYPSITENMIKSGLESTVKIVPMENYVVPELQQASSPVQKTNDLDDAIKKQQQFLDGKVKN